MLGRTTCATDSKRRRCDTGESDGNDNQSFWNIINDSESQSESIARILEELKKDFCDDNVCEQLQSKEENECAVLEENKGYHQNEYKRLKTDQDGDTILHILIAKDEQQEAIAAIEQAPPGVYGIDIANYGGQTALHVATIMGNLKIIGCLKQRRASMDVFDCDENTPLHIACSDNSTEKVRVLLLYGEQKYNLNWLNNQGLAAVHIACQKRNIAILDLLIQHGADVNVQHGPSGKTSLVMVLEEGLNDPTTKASAIEFAKLLIQRFHTKININIQTYAFYTALHYACLLDSKDMVQYLLNLNSDIGVKTSERKTEKDLATSEEIKILLEKRLRKKRRS